jgi:hypothetical protein
MSVTVAGIWDLGYNSPIKEIELWEFLLRDFGVTDFKMSPMSGVTSDFVEEFDRLDEILEVHRAQGDAVVFIDEKSPHLLEGFTHPSDVLYVFGKVGYSPIGYKEEGDLAISIETPMNSGTPWPHQIAALVLYDRFAKEKRWR